MTPLKNRLPYGLRMWLSSRALDPSPTAFPNANLFFLLVLWIEPRARLQPWAPALNADILYSYSLISKTRVWNRSIILWTYLQTLVKVCQLFNWCSFSNPGSCIELACLRGLLWAETVSSFFAFHDWDIFEEQWPVTLQSVPHTGCVWYFSWLDCGSVCWARTPLKRHCVLGHPSRGAGGCCLCSWWR